MEHYSPAPVAVPHDTREASRLGGYHVPAHTLVFVNLYSVHMNPKYWEKPEEFNPTRWIEDGMVKHHKEGFLAFSTGKPLNLITELLEQIFQSLCFMFL